MFKDSRYMQYVASFTATLSITIIGMYVSWSSPSMPLLTSDDSPIGRPVTVEEGSWIVSIMSIAPIFTTFPVIWTAEKYGRKYTLLISAGPTFAAWIMIIYADSVAMLCIARFIAGLGTGFSNAASSVYIGEIADKDIRGKLGTAFNLMKLLGCIIVLTIGPFVSYQTLGWICASVSIIYFTLFIQMPESPYYLMKVGRKEEAKINLKRLSGKSTSTDVLEKKLLDIEEIVNNDMKSKLSWRALFKKEYRMSIFVMIGIKTLQQFSGLIAIDSYMQTIIGNTHSGLTPEITSILYGVIQLPAVIFAALIVDKVGRKPILIISALGCAISLIAEGIYFYLQDYLKTDVSELSWLPTTAIITYAVMNNFGLCTLPYVLIGELFATNIKEIAASLSICYGTILAFTVQKFFEPLSVAWGRYTLFWIFAGCCILGAIFSYFVVPETKGKTFDQIQNKLNRRYQNSASIKT